MSLASQLSVKKRILSATQRLEALEKEVPKIVAGVNNGFTNLEARVNEIQEYVNALAQLVGEAEVSAKIRENQIARAEAAANAQKEGLEKAITDGRVVTADTTGEKSVIVCKETDKDGNLIPPGRVQMEFRQIIPTFKEKFLGTKVGAKVATPNGGSLEIVEIYDLVDVPPPQAANADVAPASTPGDDAPATPAADVPTDASATQPPAQA
jgi:hypothetical protein